MTRERWSCIGNPTYRGVVFRYNRFTNCGKTGSEKEAVGQAAIRLDDAISGMVIYGNVFIRSANGIFGAVQMNSGRDNIIDNNLFVDCKQGVSGGWYPGNAVWRWVAAKRLPPDFFVNDLYLKRYPEMATMTAPPGTQPRLAQPLLPLRSHDDGQQRPPRPGGERRLRRAAIPGSPTRRRATTDSARTRRRCATVGFRPIPVDEIGLYPDAYRASWPVVTTPLPMPDWRRTKSEN